MRLYERNVLRFGLAFAAGLGELKFDEAFSTQIAHQWIGSACHVCSVLVILIVFLVLLDKHASKRTMHPRETRERWFENSECLQFGRKPIHNQVDLPESTAFCSTPASNT
jgi:hypothetical protein